MDRNFKTVETSDCHRRFHVAGQKLDHRGINKTGGIFLKKYGKKISLGVTVHYVELVT